MFTLTLIGKGASSVLKELEKANIHHDRKLPRPGVVMNSGDVIEILKQATGEVPWAALAYVLVKWLQLRQSRKIIITRNNNTIIHLEGFTDKELEAILPDCKAVMVMESKAQEPEKVK